MDNYKIKVKDEAESKEAQEFLFSLGYRWGTQSETKPIHLDKPFLYTNEAFIEFGESLSIFIEAPEKELTIAELRVLAVAKQPQDPALISGADAKLAWAKGEQLQIDTGSGFEDLTDNYYLAIFDRQSNKFRLKPQTIKIELDLPKPFEPKEGEKYYLINPFQEDGYDSYVFDVDNCDHIYIQFGAYRTEEEIKQVAEQLRKIRGAS